MFSALALSWDINQPRVNRLVATPVLQQEGSGLEPELPTDSFSDLVPDRSFYVSSGCFTQAGLSQGEESGTAPSNFQGVATLGGLPNTIRPRKATCVKMEN